MMLRKRPTPPGKGGAGDVTCLAACEFSENSATLLRVQFLHANFGMPFRRAEIIADLLWGGTHG